MPQPLQVDSSASVEDQLAQTPQSCLRCSDLFCILHMCMGLIATVARIRQNRGSSSAHQQFRGRLRPSLKLKATFSIARKRHWESKYRRGCTLRLSECPEKPKLYFAWQKYFSFAKMLSNEPLYNFQINRDPSLG